MTIAGQFRTHVQVASRLGQLALFAIVSIATPASAQNATTSAVPMSDRLVSYTIQVSLDPDTRTLKGHERITWRNPDKVPVDELQFHLYLNAFRDSLSTFMVESGGRHRGFEASGGDPWGGVEIDRLTRVAATNGDQTRMPSDGADVDLTNAIRFIQPDDGNPNDRTVISVPLQSPVLPGETIALDVDFTSRLPQVVARTGWELAEDGSLFVMAAQWFPKLGVLEVPGQRFVPADADRGRWNTHQFHANSEFYADFGTFDVSIETPTDFHVGASGVLVSETESGGTTVRNFVAEDVHDFAWTASPAYRVYTDTWRHVNLKLLLQPAHNGQRKRHFAAAKVALEYYDKWLGEYPYTTLTLVDGIGGSNGMEYPTLITLGTAYGVPPWVRPLELVTIHEFGHQYFYGLMASNEFEEAWLDEGMNSYIETAIMDAEYGPGSILSFPGFPIDDGPAQRLGYTETDPFKGALFTNSWEYGRGEYSRSSYSKPATVMRTLERTQGSELMHRFLREYYNTWRFRHPTTRDLQDTYERVAGKDFGWFFDQFVYGTAVVDFSVLSIDNAADETGSWNASVELARKYDGIIPVDVRVSFADGSEQFVRWTAAGTDTTITFQTASPVTEAFIDPENKIVLELTPLDNRKSVTADALYPFKMLFKSTAWLQGLFHVVQGLF